MRRIGITGGIGSGKSVVSRLLRIMGYSGSEEADGIFVGSRAETIGVLWERYIS